MPVELSTMVQRMSLLALVLAGVDPRSGRRVVCGWWGPNYPCAHDGWSVVGTGKRAAATGVLLALQIPKWIPSVGLT